MNTPPDTVARPGDRPGRAAGHVHPGHRHGEGPPEPAAGRFRTWKTQLTATPISRAGGWIGLALIALTTLAWLYLLHAPADHTTPTMGMGALLFLAVWVAMTTATMFPAVSPMVLMYARIAAAKRTNGKAWAPVWLFVSGYLLLWTGLGLLAYLGAVAAERLAADVTWIEHNTARIGGGLIVVAGAYQFSKLKDRCLTECRSPLAFVMEHWQDGRTGAMRMGIHHGWHCAGCCWALMSMLFPLGMMNIAALAGVTAFIYAEKVLPGWRTMRYVAGAALVAFGLAVLVQPSLLPGGTTHHVHDGTHLGVGRISGLSDMSPSPIGS